MIIGVMSLWDARFQKNICISLSSTKSHCIMPRSLKRVCLIFRRSSLHSKECHKINCLDQIMSCCFNAQLNSWMWWLGLVLGAQESQHVVIHVQTQWVDSQSNLTYHSPPAGTSHTGKVTRGIVTNSYLQWEGWAWTQLTSRNKQSSV